MACLRFTITLKSKNRKMALSFDPKEDLRLRMANLERKLAESEEERCKLEKTCNVLMRAFREEEKMRYKTLNKNYEKFLQDCSVRKRRNDIILRSLCRIEDRSRTLFAKTERLKLLKDRYISYLKITDFKEEKSSQTWRTTLTTIGQKNEEPSSKVVQWKTSPLTDYNILKKDIDENNKSSEALKKAEESSPGGRFSRRSYVVDSVKRLSSPVKNPEESTGTTNWAKPVDYGVLKNNSNELEVKDLVSEAKNRLSHQESIEKLKKGLSFEEEVERHDPYDKKTDDGQQNGKNPVSFLRNSQHLLTSSSSFPEEENQDVDIKREENDFPMGLDGVDYQNETYPESYYEQPVHHSHTSIVADVILEEDETDEEEEQMLPNISTWKESPGHGGDKPRQISAELTDRDRDIDEKAIDEVKSQESDSVGNLEKKKNVRSNLIHLLESDSESFQIEHGDPVSGNEDSDFDFSFH